MRGRWAAGIEPRNFAWILKDQLAVSERPGGFAPHHRRVRRQEEILWLHAHGFTRVVSLLPSNHNLHAYDELHVPSAHFAVPAHGDTRPALAELYGALWAWLHDGERILLHMDELGEQVAGVAAGFLLWSGLLPEPPRAVSAVEQLLRRQMGHAGRLLVAAAAELPPARATHPGRPPLETVRPTVSSSPAPPVRLAREAPTTNEAVALEATVPPAGSLADPGPLPEPVAVPAKRAATKHPAAKAAPEKAPAVKPPPTKAPGAKAPGAKAPAAPTATKAPAVKAPPVRSNASGDPGAKAAGRKVAAGKAAVVKGPGGKAPAKKAPAKKAPAEKAAAEKVPAVEHPEGKRSVKHPAVEHRAKHVPATPADGAKPAGSAKVGEQARAGGKATGAAGERTARR